LALQSRRFRRSRLLALLGPAPLAGRLDGSSLDWCAHRFFAGFDFCRIQRYVTNDPFLLRRFNERFVQALGQFGFGEIGKGA